MDIDITDLKGKKAVVMGLGLHGGGLGAAKWLAEQGAKVLVTDLKSAKELEKPAKELRKYKNIKFVLGKHRAEDFKDADLVIQGPGVPAGNKFLNIAGKNGIPIETDMSLFFSLCPAPIIGITGAKGKSTTTALLYEILKKYDPRALVGGNIRISALGFLKKIRPDTPVLLELSSWQLEGLKKERLSPHISIVTNIYKEHLNRYRSFNDYIKAKELIWRYQKPDDAVILNYDNEYTRAMGEKVVSKRFWFSLRSSFKGQNGVFIRNGRIIFRLDGKEGPVCPVKDIKIPGRHNLENILAAICAAKVCGIPDKTIRIALSRFKGIGGRMEFIREYKGIKFYNDTTATHPEASIAALKALGGKKNIVLIAGGADKKLEFSDMAKTIKKYARSVVLFKGNASDKLEKELKKIDFPGLRLSLGAKSMTEAFRKALEYAKKGDIVLLSPGAASFGVFINEFDRGDRFVKKVKGLK